MRIKNAHIKDFKRFSNLTINDIPADARLVVLVGPNGSGKSSLFDAFNFWHMASCMSKGLELKRDYYLRPGAPDVKNWVELSGKINIEFYDLSYEISENPKKARNLFYFRSAYRNEPDFSLKTLSQSSDILDDDHRPYQMISLESRVSDNYQRIVSENIYKIYDPTMQSKEVSEITDDIMKPVRDSMQAAFPDLILSSMGKPLEGGTFLFDKGTSKNFNYKNLSGGEKAAFDLLLDFILKKKVFNNTVFCIDEPELHMNTTLQAKLLDIIYAQLPQDCQLWLATHSIGMMRKAFDLYIQNNNEVVFLDFTERDFDLAQVMEPATVDRQFWKKLFNVALDDLADLVAPSEIVFCEGTRELNTHSRNPSFDATVYRNIFSKTHPNTEFIPLGGTNDLEKDIVLLSGVLNTLFGSIKMWCLFDRDDRSQEEIVELTKNGTKVLRRRDIESYLWDDEVLKTLCDKNGQPNTLTVLIAEKNKLLLDASSLGKPADDIKYISGQLYNKTKDTLSLTGCGNNTQAFARDTLAPLIKPEMNIFKELEEDIFG